jgi:rubrerythrin
MAFGQTTTILEAARRYHEQLADFYLLLARGANREPIRMMLGYLRYHERHLADCLAEYEDDLPADVLETWFKYPPHLPPAQLPDDVWADPELSKDRVLELAANFDSELVRYYETAAQRAGSARVRELFESLAQFEQHEKGRVMKATAAGD